MKHRFGTTAIAFLKAVAVFGQGEDFKRDTENWEVGSFWFRPGSAQGVFSDTAGVFDSPGGRQRGRAVAYDSVRILEMGKKWYRTADVNAPWYRVGYRNRTVGGADTGWLWGGALASLTAVHEGVLFTLGAGRDTGSAQGRAPGNCEVRWSICAKTHFSLSRATAASAPLLLCF